MEETTRTLLCGDLLTQTGNGSPIAEADVVGPALAAERIFHAMSMSPNTALTLERLAGLQPQTLAIMHGSSFRGDGAAALRGLARGLL